ncbi:hypothetical protein NQ314_006396 [Rhamnusium bicolor]|uniref:Rab-GAP TBC domain-containing protein n=1 Tax=Rhamnusium bicolor TaxID=1586634 RepID=A0AAV8Z4G1_9CUCU|nr:hypothetical protein NQ314_006396 [Rhamnusium bicolor]
MLFASVGTMFALPWFLTWFGHSLNQYKDVVRLYDYFLASSPMMPLYVATSLVVHRRSEVLAESCDMASVHCLLSQIPDNLDFEEILVRASTFHKKYPPKKLEPLVKKRVQKEYVVLGLFYFFKKMLCVIKQVFTCRFYFILLSSLVFRRYHRKYM